ncbi:MAG: DUF2807 domain-containing protein [Bacteroidales bacterium]|nr:DUF2807 domain-containing protein [Candidatus Cacconaster merdequi]
MKRIIVSLLAVLAISSSAFAGNTVIKKYDYRNFVGVSVKSAFHVVLNQGETFDVSVEVPSEYLDFLSVTKQDGCLRVKFEDLPRKLRVFKNNKDFIVRITMPELYSLSLAGASSLESNGKFTSTMHDIEVNCSGASHINSLDLKAPKIEIEIDGASRATVNADASDIDIEISGASKLALSGETVSAEYDVEGASALDAKKMTASKVKIDQGGASKSVIYVTQNLMVEIGGASRCEYFAPDDVRLSSVNVTGASTLKKAKDKQ